MKTLSVAHTRLFAILCIMACLFIITGLLLAEIETGLPCDTVITHVYELKETGNRDSCLALLRNALDADNCEAYGRRILANEYAIVCHEMQDHAQADSILTYALGELETSPDGDSLTAEMYTNKAMADFYLGKTAESRACLAEALRIRIALYSEMHELVAFNYTNLGMLFNAMREYDSSLYFHQKAFDIRSAVFGPDDPKSAINLYRMSNVYSSIGIFDKADSLLAIVLDIKRKEVGDNHLSISQILNSLGILRFRQGDLNGAEDYHIQALDIQKQHVPEDDTLIAITSSNLANVYLYRHEYSKCEELYNKVYEIYLRQFGEKSIEICHILTNIGALYNYANRYPEAVRVYQRIIEILMERGELQTMEMAMAKAGLASIYNEQYRLEEAESPYLESLDIFRRILGPEHPNVAVTLFNTGLLYNKMGRFSEAIKCLQTSLEISRKAFGELHQDNAQTLSMIGTLYKDMGRFDEADSMHLQALDILRQTVPEDHPQVALCYIGLANTAGERHDFEKALQYCEKAQAIREHLYGPEGTPVYYTKTTIANILYLMGRYAEAEACYRSVYDHMLAVGDSIHPATVNTIEGIGINLYAQGKYREAIDNDIKALAMQEQLFSPTHPESVDALESLGNDYCAIGQYDSALVCFSKLFDNRQIFLNYVFSFSSENQKLLWVNYYPLFSKTLFTTALEHDTPGYRNLVAETILKCKSIVIDVSLSEKTSLLQSDDPEVSALFDSLQSKRTEAANLYLANIESVDEGKQEKFNQLTAEIESLEGQLSEQSQSIRDNVKERNFGISDISNALGESDALWEYFKFEPYDHSIVGNRNAHLGAPAYMAMRLDSQGTISLYNLGDARPIDSLVTLIRRKIDASYAYLFSENASVYERELNDVTHELYRLIVAPVADANPDDSQIYISPDDMLSLLPFEILTNDNGEYCIERYAISYLGSGRELLRQRPPSDQNASVYVFADPDFDNIPLTDTATVADNIADIDARIREDRLAMFRSSDCLNTNHRRLSYSRNEADEIRRTLRRTNKFDISEYVGIDAEEARVKSIPDPPFILHISTHGFFCGADTLTDVRETINPLLRSGLVFAGANVYHDRQIYSDADSYTEDGILTALEASQLNLMNTELVTLSACETGVGGVIGTEGVFGLSRSFRHAGARSLITSLWKVPDEESAELMSLFYSNWLSGQSKRSALRDASLAMMKKARDNRGFAHPILWGGFILTGDPN
ncbi:MAG: CHAT domain-containing tetratricopeptide repeat protein [Candidatus Zixiibacteriota bacterium]